MSTTTTRRSFLAYAGAGWTFFTGAAVAGLALAGRFMFPNDLFEPPTKFKIGFPNDYAASSRGEVSEKYKSRGIWIGRDLAGFYVLSTVCTHLGCTPNWLPTERKFKCPCHGSGFYPDGVNFEGPAPRPLERHKVSLAADGQIEVDKARKFQQELGQWEDPDAFLSLPYTG
ncbi:MAG: ubiquinol-cytochrome c reductase iron-sulfur subunit [Planctomycetota bacterium]